MSRKLTQQERTFAEHYALTGNGRQSAILSGYSDTNASQAACRLLKRARVNDEVERVRKAIPQQSTATPHMLEQFYLKIMADDSKASPIAKLKAADQLSRLKGFYRNALALLLSLNEEEIRSLVDQVKQRHTAIPIPETHGK